MSKLKNWFLNQNMSWIKVIIFAVMTAVVTTIPLVIPALENTSFRDIGITVDCWILFAVFIIVNCNKWWEACLKTFVFFLISQPLIYLFQLPFNGYDFGIFSYYKFWGIVTILTLPGAFIAYQLKRRNWLSLIVLAVVEAYFGYAMASYLWSIIYDFPHHLISFIFCLLCSIFFAYIFFDKKMLSIIAILVVVVSCVVSLIIEKPTLDQSITLPEGEWSYSIEGDEIVEVNQVDDNDFTLKVKDKGNTILMFKDENGNVKEFDVTITPGGIYANEITD